LVTKNDTTGFTTIFGRLNSNPNQDFTVQCFVGEPDPSDHGEGQSPAGQDTSVTTDVDGEAGFVCSSSNLIPGQTVSATATNMATGDTSEFSENKLIPGSGP
jgi:hypothetical protein